MPANVQALPAAFGPAYIRPAEIVHTAPGHVYRVGLTGSGPTEEMTAHLATALTQPLKIGDRVLLAGESSTCGYIIGVLNAGQLMSIGTADGSGAHIQGEGENQAIAVHDDHGRTVFEYYPDGGRSVVKAPRGDLQLSAPHGNIDLQAGKGIHCIGEEEVSIFGNRRVRVSAKGHGRLPEQSLCMDDKGVSLGVHKIDVSAGKGEIRIARASYHGKQVTSSIDRAKLSYTRLEIVAHRIMQRSEHLFQKVGQLCQMQVGRLRTLVKGAHHVQSQRTTLIAEEDVRIDGKKINLG